MNKDQLLGIGSKLHQTFQELEELHTTIDDGFLAQFNRSLPFSEGLNDRWKRAQRLGFGEGTSLYDSCYVLGDVKVGKDVWIGMFTILDGSGGLSIGDNCTISAGVHIYSHSSVNRTLSRNVLPIETASVHIGDWTYIAPNCVISMGVTIGAGCLIGANSFVNKDIPDGAVAVGSPAKIIGFVSFENGKVSIQRVDGEK